jgi:NADH-quinone oxidoreductase subunit D
MAEGRTWLQYIPDTDRVDYITSMASNYVYCLAVEKLADIFVHPRAEYIRAIMLELNRIASHLLYLGIFGMDIGATTAFLYGMRDRERIIDLFEMASGGRLLYNYFRFGGVSRDLPEGWESKAKECLEYLKPRVEELENLLLGNVIFLERTKGVGAFTAQEGIRWGVTGPNLRATGFSCDLRRDAPFNPVYGEVEWDIPVGTMGDTWDRFWVRLQEVRESIRIIEQLLAKIPRRGTWPTGRTWPAPAGSDYRADRTMRLRPPAGEACGRLESPRGELCCLVVSDAEERPYRVHFRTGSFGSLGILSHILKGVMLADVVAIFGSLDIILPEVDR